jgi:predicted deacetylase
MQQHEQPQVLVSIHDLMPQTMPAVRETIALLEQHHISPVTLLVVPGTGWSRTDIDELRALQRAGYRLAGHGWRHRVERIRRPYHRLHSLLISRDVAEHLDLDSDGIIDLIGRCHHWFADHGLEPPALYVPPAWAMGRVSAVQLIEDTPFGLYEDFNGVFDARNGRYHRIPMLGYEADQAIRVPIIRSWNALNRWRGAHNGRLRIGLHPYDFGLRMGAQLARDLATYSAAIDYQAL